MNKIHFLINSAILPVLIISIPGFIFLKILEGSYSSGDG
jgi:hypothetical protein